MLAHHSVILDLCFNSMLMERLRKIRESADCMGPLSLWRCELLNHSMLIDFLGVSNTKRSIANLWIHREKPTVGILLVNR